MLGLVRAKPDALRDLLVPGLAKDEETDYVGKHDTLGGVPPLGSERQGFGVS